MYATPTTLLNFFSTSMEDNLQSAIVNPNGTLADQFPVEHSNYRNATQISMHVQVGPSVTQEIDLNQLCTMVSYLLEQLVCLQHQCDLPLSVKNAIENVDTVAN